MLILEHTHSLPEALLPDYAIAQLSEEKKPDKEKRAILYLLINNILEAARAYKSHSFTLFDVSIGDYGCQHRAIKILNLAKSQAFAEELDQIVLTALKVAQEMNNLMKTLPAFQKNKKHQDHSSKELTAFFREKILTLKLSTDMRYLLQAHLLTFAKIVGYEKDDIQLGRWNKLAKWVFSDALKNDIFDKARAEISQSSVAAVQEEADKMSTLSLEQAKRARTILAMVRKQSPKPKKLPLSFVCQYYSMKTVLTRLKEMEATVVLKKWLLSKEDTDMEPILFRGKKDGFTRLSNEEASKIAPQEPVVVFEGLVHHTLGKEDLAAHFDKYGLEAVVLIDTAQENQFEKDGNGLEFIQDAEAKEEILSYQSKGRQLNTRIEDKKGSFFWLDHAYCSSMKSERKASGGNV